jgi:hypothetical protein
MIGVWLARTASIGNGGEQMERDTLLKQWEDGVSLGSAWWVFADLSRKKRFRELQQAGSQTDRASHMGFRHALEDDVIGRLSSGDLQAFGIEFGSPGEPIAIPNKYFWKGAEIDFGNDTVAALGRKFGQVTVQGKREPIVETSPEMISIDPRQLEAELYAFHILPTETEPEDDPGVVRAPGPLPEPERGKAAPQQFIEEKLRGRPSKAREIEQAIDILLRQGVDLATMPRPKAYKAVRKCAETDLKSNTEIGFTDPVIQRALFRRFGRRR